MTDLSEAMFPAADIDAHLKHLRGLAPSTDPEAIARATTKGKAVASAYCETAHAIANMIDTYRVNGYSAGEAVQSIWESFLDPIASVPVIDTTHD